MLIGVYLSCHLSMHEWHKWLIFSCRKGLNAQQTAFAIKKYKSHRRVGLPSEILASMKQ